MKISNKNAPCGTGIPTKGHKQIIKTIISEKGGKFNERIKRP